MKNKHNGINELFESMVQVLGPVILFNLKDKAFDKWQETGDKFHEDCYITLSKICDIWKKDNGLPAF